MKKLLALLLVASLGFAVVGCKGSSSSDDSSAAAPKLKDKTPKDSGGDE